MWALCGSVALRVGGVEKALCGSVALRVGKFVFCGRFTAIVITVVHALV